MEGGYFDASQMMTGWGGMIFGPVFMLLALGIFIALIVLLVRWMTGDSPRRAGPGDNSLSLLKERFAKGEIDRNEFEDRKKLLQEN